MRRELHAALVALLPDGDFGYLLRQRGMFSYTGMSPAQVERLREEHGVYILRSGSMVPLGTAPEYRGDGEGLRCSLGA